MWGEGLPEKFKGGSCAFWFNCLKVIWCDESARLKFVFLVWFVLSTLIDWGDAILWLAAPKLNCILFCVGWFTGTFLLRLSCLLCIGSYCGIV
jgi:hypothetical protein